MPRTVEHHDVPAERTPSGRALRRTDQPLNPHVDPYFAQIWARARALGMNQRQLADRAGVPHSVVSALLAGRHGMTTPTGDRLAAAVGGRLGLVHDGVVWPDGPVLRGLVRAAVAWRSSLGDSADLWLEAGGPAAELVRAVDALTARMPVERGARVEPGGEQS